MQDENISKREAPSEPEMNILKPLAEKTAAKFQECNDISQKEGHDHLLKSKSKKRVRFQECNDIIQNEGRDDLLKSKSKMQVRKLWSKTTHVAHFETNSEIGQQKAQGDASKSKVPARKSLSPTTSASHFQECNEIGKQEAHDVFSKFMVPKNKLLSPATIVSELQGHKSIGQQEVHRDVQFKMSKRKLLAQATSVAQFQTQSETGQEELKVPEIAQFQAQTEIVQEELKVQEIAEKRQKSGNSLKGFDSTRSPSNDRPENSQLSKLNSEYRTWRRKYLILEEQRSMLEAALKKTENKVKNLENEKLGLLDKLVVLEGLVDPPSCNSPSQE